VKRKEYVWDTLSAVCESYHIINRSFRNSFKWFPEAIDKLEMKRINRIYKELEEDHKKMDPNGKKTNINEDDFE
jgi:hypothetical protein